MNATMRLLIIGIIACVAGAGALEYRSRAAESAEVRKAALELAVICGRVKAEGGYNGSSLGLYQIARWLDVHKASHPLYNEARSLRGLCEIATNDFKDGRTERSERLFAENEKTADYLFQLANNFKP